MTEQTAQFHRDLDELDSLIRAARGMVGPSAVGNAQINQHFDQRAHWPAMFAMLCGVMMVVTLALLIALFVDHSRKIGALDDKLTAIYMIAPSIQPEKKK